MKKLFFLLLVLTTQITARELEWHDGSVVLASRKVLTGKITIESAFDLVLLRAGDSCLVLPAHKVLSLYFYDADENINRKFVSLKENEDTRAPQHFYEVVLYGKVNVVRRLPLTRPRRRGADAQDYVYFVQWENALTKLDHFKKDIYPTLLSSSGKMLGEFVSANRLDPADAAQAIRIIEYYDHTIVAGALARH
ncbi:hypothetical protein SAMN04488109_3936 [Chryseolinea serpens]|uniref:Uncharacterized protein n=1 Tax=Chryseolinea serpens TaxID=947013 RepID=A0A1M5SHC3_9BACT|nr:hypothetical protein [Chryseolinea serpens]SHH37944.1 hypothetical protein SAMN04488109_3936 [Chryseolinea serpens]